MRLSIFTSALLIALAAPHGAQAAAAATTDQVEVELVSANVALVPGQSAWLGLRFKHAPQWHTYWINPGDSGLPTKLSWTLPAGYRADDIAWPVPKRFRVGDLYNFGYDGEMVLPVRIAVPGNAAVGSTAAIDVEAKWLVCHEECVPGKGALHIDLPVAATTRPDSRVAALFAAARAAQPSDSRRQAQARIDGERIEVTIEDAEGQRLPTDAFARQTRIAANAPPEIGRRNGRLVLVFAKSDYFTSAPDRFELLLIDGPAQAALIRAPFASASRSNSTP